MKNFKQYLRDSLNEQYQGHDVDGRDADPFGWGGGHFELPPDWPGDPDGDGKVEYPPGSGQWWWHVPGDPNDIDDDGHWSNGDDDSPIYDEPYDPYVPEDKPHVTPIIPDDIWWELPPAARPFYRPTTPYQVNPDTREPIRPEPGPTWAPGIG